MAPLPFDLRSLEIFMSVCDQGTMSAAARSLGLTQSAVSQAITDLEQRTRTSLFNRDVRPLGLTLSGIVLRQRASAVLAECRQIVPLLQDVRKGKLPLIRVGLVDSFSRLLVPDLPHHLLQLTDHVSFISGLTSAHVEEILSRKLDVLLGVDEFDRQEGLESWPLLEEPYVVIAPLGTPAPDTIADLAELNRRVAFVRFHPRRKIGVSIDRHLRRIGLDLPKTQEFDTPFGVAAMVATGEAWAITTPLCIYEAREFAPRLSCLPLPGPGLSRRLSLIARIRELARIPREAAAFAIGRLRTEFIPVALALMPWLEGSLTTGDEIQAGD